MKAKVKSLARIVSENLGKISYVNVEGCNIIEVGFNDGDLIHDKMMSDMIVNFYTHTFRGRYDFKSDKDYCYKKDWLYDIQEEKKEMTVGEIENKLGYSIKIIKE